jgi:hypothetical protein
MLRIQTERGCKVSFSFQQLASLGCLVAATLLISPVSSYAQSGGQKRDVVVDTKTPSSLLAQKTGNYFALIVGINDYQRLPHLSTPRNDAQELASVLSDQFGFKTQLLLDATRDQILKALDGYRRTLGESDNLLIYYSGHGYFDKETGQAYWAPVDAGLDTFARWIITTEITATAKAVPARHVLVISDSSYSGMITLDARHPTPSDRANYLEKMLQTKSRDVMSSGGDEPVADSDASDHSSHRSVFANVLLQNLSQFPSNEFTAEQLFTQIKEQVAARARQVPSYNPIRDSLHEGGDFVFIRARKGEVNEGTASSLHSLEREPPSTPENPDQEAVRTVLDNYEEAYSSMDVSELRKVWPSLSRNQEKEIKSSFDSPGLKAIKIQLRNRTTRIDGGKATATCDQWMVYTFAGRRQPPQTNSVEILLSKNSEGTWVVNEVKGK